MKQSVLGMWQATPLLLMWKCTYWPYTSYRDNWRSNQLSSPWKLIGMDHSTIWAMVSFINIWYPLKWFLSLFWNFADYLLGHDELHPKAACNWIGSSFCPSLPTSLDTGEIPKEWSLANIYPLYKKGDRALTCNYCPVSLSCVPCKLLEHVVCSNIIAHLDNYKLLSGSG